MVASIVAPLILAFLVMIFALLVGMVVGVVLALRFLRRKYRALRDHAVVRGLSGTVGVIEARLGGARQGPTGALAGGVAGMWSPARARRQMWRSVGSAEQAVAAAARADAPVGDLPALSANLHAVALRLDDVLRAEASGATRRGLGPAGSTGAPQLLRQVDEVRLAAAHVRAAAVDAASEVHGPRVQALLDDAATELQCVQAGVVALQRARS